MKILQRQRSRPCDEKAHEVRCALFDQFAVQLPGRYLDMLAGPPVPPVEGGTSSMEPPVTDGGVVPGGAMHPSHAAALMNAYAPSVRAMRPYMLAHEMHAMSSVRQRRSSVASAPAQHSMSSASHEHHVPGVASAASEVVVECLGCVSDCVKGVRQCVRYLHATHTWYYPECDSRFKGRV